MDFFKIFSNIFKGAKSFLSGGGGTAAIGPFTPANRPPNTVQVPFIQQPGQFSIPSQTGASTPAIIGEKPASGFNYYNPADIGAGGIIKSGAKPISSTFDLTGLVPQIRPLINAQPITPLSVPNQPTPAITNNPNTTIPSSPASTGFTTSEPTVIAQPALAGNSALSTPSGIPSNPSGAASGFFAGFSPTTLSGFARSIGTPPNRINPQTGEIINPTADEIEQFNRLFKTTKPKAIDVTQIGAEPFKVEVIKAPISAERLLSEEKTGLLKTAQENQQNLQIKVNKAYDAFPPIPTQPVIETKEQAEAVRNSADPFGLQTAIDNSRTKNGLPNLENQRIETMKNIQALNQGLSEIVKEIQETPGVPKAIIQNKLINFIKTNQPFLDKLNGTLQIINTQIDQANEAVNREFGIKKFGVEQGISEQKTKQAQEEQARDNARQVVLNKETYSGLDESQKQFLWKQAGFTGTPPKSVDKAQIEASRQSAIIDIYKQGVTDPGTIFNYINFDQSGKRIGDVSVKEIKEVIDFLKPKSEKTNTTFTDKVINGRLVRILAEKDTGKVISQTDLGPAGEVSTADKKSQFIQALSLIEPNTKTKNELRQAAMSIGLNPDDNDLSAAIGNVNTISSIRRFFGF